MVELLGWKPLEPLSFTEAFSEYSNKNSNDWKNNNRVVHDGKAFLSFPFPSSPALFFPFEQLLYLCSVQNVVIQFEILTFLCLHLFMAG